MPDDRDHQDHQDKQDKQDHRARQVQHSQQLQELQQVHQVRQVQQVHEDRQDDAAGDGIREYRMAELARAAGIPVRTVRYYRERGLLRPPRREGRIAWYDEHHLARLRTIAGLLERGHNLNGIADLASALENGRGIHDVLGMNAPTEETPVSLSPEEMADYFGADVTPENLTDALELGYLATDGDHLVHMSRRLLEVSSALVRSGVPLSAVLAAGREVRAHTDALAALFTGLLRTHAPDADPATLRPLAKSVVEAELSLALDHHLAADPAGPGQRQPPG